MISSATCDIASGELAIHTKEGWFPPIAMLWAAKSSNESVDRMKMGVGTRERDPQTAGAVGCRGEELRGPLPQKKIPQDHSQTTQVSEVSRPLNADPEIKRQEIPPGGCGL